LYLPNELNLLFLALSFAWICDSFLFNSILL
jgi:hypothetical protein